MTDERHRLEAQLVDVRQALSEARSADVRTFLRELLAACEEQLAQLAGGGTPSAKPAPAREAQEPLP